MKPALLLVAVAFGVLLGLPSSSAAPCECSSKKELPARECGEDDARYYRRVFTVESSSECSVNKFYKTVFQHYTNEDKSAYVKRIDFIFSNVYANLDCRVNLKRQDFLQKYYEYKFEKRSDEDDEKYFERVLTRRDESEDVYVCKCELLKKFVKKIDWSKVVIEGKTRRGFSLISKIKARSCGDDEEKNKREETKRSKKSEGSCGCKKQCGCKEKKKEEREENERKIREREEERRANEEKNRQREREEEENKRRVEEQKRQHAENERRINEREENEKKRREEEERRANEEKNRQREREQEENKRREEEQKRQHAENERRIKEQEENERKRREEEERRANEEKNRQREREQEENKRRVEEQKRQYAENERRIKEREENERKRREEEERRVNEEKKRQREREEEENKRRVEEQKRQQAENEARKIEERDRVNNENVQKCEARKKEQEVNVREWIEANYCRKSNEDDRTYFHRICTKTVSTDEEYIKRVTQVRSVYTDLDLWYNEQYLSETRQYYSLVYTKKSSESVEEYYRRLVTKESFETDLSCARRIYILHILFPSLPLWYEEQYYSYVKSFYQTYYRKEQSVSDEVYLQSVFTKCTGETEENFWKRVKLVQKTFPDYQCWYNKEYLQRLDACKGVRDVKSEEELQQKVQCGESEEARKAKLACLQVFFKSSKKSSKKVQTSEESQEEEVSYGSSSRCSK